MPDTLKRRSRAAAVTADPRIMRYRKAAEAMAKGRYDVALPAGGNDEMGELGRALAQLGGALRNRCSSLRTLLEVTGRINSGIVLEEVLDYIYESLRDIIPYDRIGCALIEPVDMVVRAVWARSESRRLELPPGYSLPLARTSLAAVLKGGEPRIINDLQEYLLEHPESEATRRMVEEGHCSSLTCPLVVAGRPLGFLFFSSMRPDTYADAHVETYLEIAAHLSMNVEKGILLQQLRETKRRLLEANQALVELANLDGLTGLPNRRHFDILFDREWSRMKRAGEPLSLIMADIDYFKQYNDMYGHLAGDGVLRRVAECLSGNTQRGTDLVARFGGEEFVILLPATGDDGAMIMAERLRKRVEELEIEHRGSRVADRVTISLGVAGGPSMEAQRAEELLDKADSALYMAKQFGRNRVAAFVEQDGETQGIR